MRLIFAFALLIVIIAMIKDNPEKREQSLIIDEPPPTTLSHDTFQPYKIIPHKKFDNKKIVPVER